MLAITTEQEALLKDTLRIKLCGMESLRDIKQGRCSHGRLPLFFLIFFYYDLIPHNI